MNIYKTNKNKNKKKKKKKTNKNKMKPKNPNTNAYNLPTKWKKKVKLTNHRGKAKPTKRMSIKFILIYAKQTMNTKRV